MEKYIIVTSKGQNPNDFVSHFGDNMDQDTANNYYEIALKEVYHAPIYNITEQNNSFELQRSDGDAAQTLQIPVGFYENNCDILKAIAITIENEAERALVDSSERNYLQSKFPLKISYKITGEAVTLELEKRIKVEFSVRDSPLLRHLGYIMDKNISRIDINISRFHNAITPAFIYSSCVGNSIFDDTQSRLLAIAPLNSKAGYNHYEFQNPSYVTLAIQSLRDINFITMDMDGEKISFDYLDDTGLISKYPTILKLHVRKRV